MDIDECEHKSLHGCHVDALCDNIFGSWNCTCKNGHEGTGEQCRDLDECLLGISFNFFYRQNERIVVRKTIILSFFSNFSYDFVFFFCVKASSLIFFDSKSWFLIHCFLKVNMNSVYS